MNIKDKYEIILKMMLIANNIPVEQLRPLKLIWNKDSNKGLYFGHWLNKFNPILRFSADNMKVVEVLFDTLPDEKLVEYQWLLSVNKGEIVRLLK